MELYEYGQNRQFNLPLSKAQETIVLHLLGIIFDYHNHSYIQFTDSALEKLFEMEQNPLKLSHSELKKELDKLLDK